MKRLLQAAFVSLLLIAPAHAVLPDEQLADPKLEARARHISQVLRCVVCQNQTIDDSDASLAHDLRVLLRERLLKGDTDEQAKAYLVKRYGTYVLLKPPFDDSTLILWLGPFGALLVGAAGAAFFFRNRMPGANAEAPLTAEEQSVLDSMLGDKRT